MSSTNKTSHYDLSQYIGTDKPTYLGDYNADMLAIDTAIYTASENASTAVSTANSAASAASNAATVASAATTTANNAADKADLAKTTAETASTNASEALTAAQGAQTAAAANTITNLAPAYDPTLTYTVGDLVTYIDEQGSGKLYKCIVDIDVPEAFNINKWDDVTTSETYAKSYIIIDTFTSDGTATWDSMISSLLNKDLTNFIDLILIREEANNDNTYFTLSERSAVLNRFNVVQGIATVTSIISVAYHSTQGNTATLVSLKNDGTFTFTDLSSATISDGTKFVLAGRYL